MPETSQITSQPHHLSVIIPLYNEVESVAPLLENVHSALSDYPFPWELVLVDDGSRDGTVRALQSLQRTYGDHVRVVELQRNFGQTAAMQAGIDVARGDVLVTLDGDLQNDPKDIPRLVTRLLDEDLDLVAGWRHNRKDGLWLRKIPSRIANRLIGKITQVQIHDYGCTLKAYRTAVIRSVRLYGEMHRFIPAWVAAYTQPERIKEEPVNHHARQFGQSKYTLSRTFRVILDLLSVFFFLRFLNRPGHFFGKIGLYMGGLGSLILGYLLVIKVCFGASIGQRPLLMLGILLVLMAAQFLTTGILSEMLTRTYYSSGDHKSYAIRQTASCAQPSDWKTTGKTAASATPDRHTTETTSTTATPDWKTTGKA